jgi:hypothetical protein
MAEKLDLKEIVDFKELLMSEVIQSEALINILDKKGIVSKQELLEEMRKVNAKMIKSKAFKNGDDNKILITVELALYLVSQEIPGEGKDALLELKQDISLTSELDPEKKQDLLKHVDDAFAALQKYNFTLTSWHLWKIHRIMTGRSW